LTFLLIVLFVYSADLYDTGTAWAVERKLLIGRNDGDDYVSVRVSGNLNDTVKSISGITGYKVQGTADIGYVLGSSGIGFGADVTYINSMTSFGQYNSTLNAFRVGPFFSYNIILLPKLIEFVPSIIPIYVLNNETYNVNNIDVSVKNDIVGKVSADLKLYILKDQNFFITLGGSLNYGYGSITGFNTIDFDAQVGIGIDIKSINLKDRPKYAY
jgi:hypothetical protein